MRYGSFSIFYEDELVNYLDENDQKIRDKIKSESEKYILNVNETEYINHLVDLFTINYPKINFDDVFIDSTEKLVESQRPKSPFDFYNDYESYPTHIIIYNIPFKGNGNLIEYRPNPYRMWTRDVTICNDCICFEVINSDNDSEEIKKEAQGVIDSIKDQYQNVMNQLNEYNPHLQNFIESIFKSRKESILEKNQTLASLGVPIKKKSVPYTHAIPNPNMRQKIRVKPEVTERGYSPEPSLDETTYFKILNLLNEACKVFETHPSTYEKKDEEALRDLLLFHLQPQFEGSVTGETFNKSGKTDICIKHDGGNVFIAECKFWRGEKSYLDAISQLLNYLTWRDSKSAVIIFVKNKDISSVLKKIREATPKHENFLGHVNDKTESWFNYRFHINDDRNREVKLAILIFHIPD